MMVARTVLVLLISLGLLAVFSLEKNPKVEGSYHQIQESYPIPQINDEIYKKPSIDAKSAVVLDSKTGKVLFEKNQTTRHLPASTVKLLTSLVALENCSPNESVKVTYVEEEPFQMGLVTGDILTVESLIYGLLMASANDAAYVLATSCSPSIDEFVQAMNEKARLLGMKNSHFTNPAGFDDEANYTTAYDLARLGKAAVANPLLAKVVATKSTVVSDVGGIKAYYLDNINKLLGEVNGVEGIKTGETPLALGNLITKTTRENNTILTVVLGTTDRFQDSRELIEWVFSSYHWENPT